MNLPATRRRSHPRPLWPGWLLAAWLSGFAGFALAAQPVPPEVTAALTNLTGVRNLTVEQAQLHPPVDVTGVVTWVDFSGRGCFLDDGVTSVWVDGESGLPQGTQPGSRLRAVGTAQAGFFTPAISASRLVALGVGPLPAPRLAPAWEQRQGKWDGLRVSLEGTLFQTQDAAGVEEWRVLSDGVSVGLTSLESVKPRFPALPQRVRVTGISSLGVVDRRVLDCSLLLTAWDQVQFLLEPAAPPARVAVGQLARGTNAAWLDRLVQLDGVVTWRSANKLFVQDDSGGIAVQLTNALAPPLRSVVTVTGGARRQPGRMEFAATGISAGPPTNLPPPWPLAEGDGLREPELNGRRVSLAGRLVHRQWSGDHEEWLLVRPDQPEHFRAWLPLHRPAGVLDGFKLDSTLELTGVLQTDSNPDGRVADALLLVAEEHEVRLLAAAPLTHGWSVALLATTAVTLLASFAGAAWWWHSLRLSRLRQAQLETENRLKSRFALIAETASDQIVALDFRGQITFINPVGHRLLAHQEDSLIGQSYARWVAPEYRERWLRAVTATAAGEQIRPFDIEVERGDGSRLEVEMLLRRLSGEEIQCIGRDLTETRRTQRELARQEVQLRTIVDSMAEGIIVIDAGRVVVSLNPAAERILGLPGSVLQGRPLAPDWQCLLPDGAKLPPEQHPLNRTLLTGEPVDAFQMGFMAGDGQRRWITVNSRVLTRGAGGQVEQVIATFADITSRRTAEQQRQQLEEQLRHSEKLRALGTLAGGIAHDFNNLLASMLGNAELIQMDLPRGHPAAENAREIFTVAQRGADLVRRILSFSRPQPAALISLKLSSVVDDSLRVMSKALPPGVRLHCHFEAGEPELCGDPAQLGQVVINLCTNAAHALEEHGGDLEVRVEPLELTPDFATANPPLKPGPAVRLTVRDTGAGMDAVTRARVFEPFFTTKGPGRGTGLGLAIVHNIVQAHGGRVFLESAVGRGTRIDVVLPVEAGPTAPAGNGVPVGELPRGAGEEVLVVDDDASVLRFVDRALSGLGYRVTAVASPPVALAHLQREPERFSLLLTDLTMPEQSGVDLALTVRALLPNLPIVIATGYGQTAFEQLARAHNRFPVLSKPFQLPELATLLRAELHRPPDANPG